jgi:hypothetical protein
MGSLISHRSTSVATPDSPETQISFEMLETTPDWMTEWPVFDVLRAEAVLWKLPTRQRVRARVMGELHGRQNDTKILIRGYLRNKDESLLNKIEFLDWLKPIDHDVYAMAVDVLGTDIADCNAFNAIALCMPTLMRVENWLIDNAEQLKDRVFDMFIAQWSRGLPGSAVTFARRVKIGDHVTQYGLDLCLTERLKRKHVADEVAEAINQMINRASQDILRRVGRNLIRSSGELSTMLEGIALLSHRYSVEDDVFEGDWVNADIVHRIRKSRLLPDGRWMYRVFTPTRVPAADWLWRQVSSLLPDCGNVYRGTRLQLCEKHVFVGLWVKQGKGTALHLGFDIWRNAIEIIFLAPWVSKEVQAEIRLLCLETINRHAACDGDQNGDEQNQGENSQSSVALNDADDPSIPQCICCVSTPRNCLLSPCNHICLCLDCACSLSRCPICQTTIVARLQVFIA